MKAALLLLFFSPYALADCNLKLDELTGTYPPLLLKNGEFVMPNSEERILTFGEGEQLELYCHGSIRYDASTVVRVSGLPESKSVLLTCNDGQFFSDETQANVVSATCNRKQEPRLVRTHEECSPIGADGRSDNLTDLWSVQIGWKIHDDFKEQIKLCIDEKVYGTIWTAHNVTSKIDYRDIDPGRPGFRIDNRYLKRFFTWTANYKMNKYYSKASQESTVTNLLGSNLINGELLIESSTSGTNYFAKGHLAPDAAFFYNVFQDATYYFMNVAPQFQSFNNGNWKALEGSVRDFADKMKKDLLVVTGTYGVLSYPDENNNEQEIYLYKQFIPAPKYFWKVVVDPETQAGVAFIGLNDPHVTEAPKELCPSRCAEMAWVDWSINELDSGFMYCCTPEEASEAFPSIPKITTTGLLHMEEP